eukprot:5462774-Pleurochrysis_carterae.AAC.1
MSNPMEARPSSSCRVDTLTSSRIMNTAGFRLRCNDTAARGAAHAVRPVLIAVVFVVDLRQQSQERTLLAQW